VVRLAAASAGTLLGQIDGGPGHPLVDEAAHHTGTVAAIRIAAMEEPSRTAGTRSGEGDSHARHSNPSLSDQPVCPTPPTRYALGQHSLCRRVRGGWWARARTEGARTRAATGRPLCPSLAARERPGWLPLPVLRRVATGLPARLGLARAGPAVALPRLRHGPDRHSAVRALARRRAGRRPMIGDGGTAHGGQI
jgi:hypothetical protein